MTLVNTAFTSYLASPQQLPILDYKHTACTHVKQYYHSHDLSEKHFKSMTQFHLCLVIFQQTLFLFTNNQHW